MTLPPGQRALDRFPRFGTHLHEPPPPVPADPAIEVAGAVTAPFTVALADLASLPRREVTADFHCVAGWSATGLRWEGVAFRDFYERLVAPALRPDVTITHVVFQGLDGYRVAVLLEDLLADNVLIAEHLDGSPLDGDHGAPARLVSPDQYGFVNAKHVCRIEAHASAPADSFGGHAAARLLLRLYARHPRARVWEEERHRYLPGRALRPVGRFVMGPVRRLGNRHR